LLAGKPGTGISRRIRATREFSPQVHSAPFLGQAPSLFDGSPIAAAVLVTAITGVTLSNLIVDGSQNQINGCAPDLMGVYFQNASGTITNSAVRYFELASGLEGCQSGEGIFVEAGGGGTAAVTASGNSVHDFQKNGITADELGASLTATSNAVTGWGPTPFIAQNGIQIGFGATGTITSNTVTNVVYSPCTSTSNCGASATGILIYDPSSGVNTRMNNISGTQGAIYYLSASNGSITNNTISQTLVFDGIAIDTDESNPGTGNTVSANHILNSSESGMYVNTASNSITNNTIDEAPIGIWFFTLGSSQSGNKLYATPVQVKNGGPAPPTTGRHGMKAQPVR
jgi:hypothetical protein